ncbi:MAG: DUF4440 domain-containing protein [Chthoniobacterales bacterium]
MNTKLLALFTLTLALAPFALGQEAVPNPDEKIKLRGPEPSLRTEPSVSVPTDTPAREYPRPGEPVATPRPTSTPKEAAAASPSPTPRPTRAAKTAAKPTATPAPTEKEKSLPATVPEAEKQWAAAIAKHDIATIESLLANDYVGVTSAGRVVKKAAVIADLKKDKNTYDSVTNSRLETRAHGDATVVVGTTNQRGKDAAGRAFNYTYRWTDIWVKQDGRWQCVASQSIQVRG